MTEGTDPVGYPTTGGTTRGGPAGRADGSAPTDAPDDGPTAAGTDGDGSPAGAGDGPGYGDTVTPPDAIRNRAVGWQPSRMFHEFFEIPFLRTDVGPDVSTDVDLVRGPVRKLIRTAPWVVLVGGVLALFEVTFEWHVPALSEAGVLPIPTSWAVGAAVLLLFSAATLVETPLFQATSDAMMAVFVYGLTTILVVGMVASILLALGGNGSSSIVYASGFLLAALVGGGLAEDAATRFEYLLGNLDQVEIFDVPEDFNPDVGASDALFGLPFSVVFATSVVLFFGSVWWLGQGPQGLDSTVLLGLNVLIDFVIVVYLVRFLIVERRLLRLLQQNGDVPGEVVYSPFHPDEAGGYGLLGRAAMRVNHMLALAGLFYVYRIFFVGGRVFPVDVLAVAGQGIPIRTLRDIVLWAVNYGAPILAYSAAVLLWFHHSLWEMHRQMIRRKRATRAALQAYYASDSRDPESLVHLDERTAGLAASLDEDVVLERLDSAPVWPVQGRALVGLAVANVLPIVLSLLQAAGSYYSA